MTRMLQYDDVVFMYLAEDNQAYIDYGATFLAWGGAHTLASVRRHEELGIHATGSMWCLTAGAENLHTDPDLREATCRDIEGHPIAVPWLPDHTFEGTPSYFGCTNHPTFRAHVRKTVAQVMSGTAHGLHVDDHLGSAHPAFGHGGCFCDYCMEAFRHWLQANETPMLLTEGGVASFDDFDYRTLVRRYATTRASYLEVQKEIPLHQVFVDCQLQLAAENTRQLGELASEITNRPVTLSANTCLPHLEHVVVSPYLTHLVGEVTQYAAEGTARLINAVQAYRLAEALGKPIAATAAGTDWAYVKEHELESLVTIWIALSYACGQRLMAPHKMWCFTQEKGTHWYHGPTSVYAPLYRFVRENPVLLRDCRTVGPLSVPDGLPNLFNTHNQRETLRTALADGDPRPLDAGDRLWVLPRERVDGTAVVHIVNLAYDLDEDTIAHQQNVAIRIPGSVYSRVYTEAVCYCYDADPVPVAVETGPDLALTIHFPEQRLWSIVVCRERDSQR